jgi:hypothetical protein
MDPLEKLEASLDETLREKAPLRIPRDWAQMVAVNLWWIVLILAVLQLYSAINLWDWGHTPVDGPTAINYYTTGVARHLGLFFYAAVFMTAGVALLQLLSAAHLKAMRKAGWNLVFYSIVLDVFASVVALFAEGGGVRAFLGGVVGTVVAAFVLFQVRSYFIMSHDGIRKHTEEHYDLKPDHKDHKGPKTDHAEKEKAADDEAPAAKPDKKDD